MAPKFLNAVGPGTRNWILKRSTPLNAVPPANPLFRLILNWGPGLDISKYFCRSRAPVLFIYCFIFSFAFTWQRSGPGILKNIKTRVVFFLFLLYVLIKCLYLYKL